MFLAARQGEQIPPGLLLDEHGHPTTDSTDFPDAGRMAELASRSGPAIPFAVKGTLVPLGASHKGYALVFMVGLLSMLLTETSPAWDFSYDRPEDGRYGTVLVAVDPRAFDPDGAIGEKVDAFIDRLASSPRIDGVDEILYPGQRSQALKKQRRHEGTVEIPASHLEAMQQLALDFGMEPPKAEAS
jgi:LDH2 family malate/lactate/ureidoglycolate dehydrogenase